MPILNPGFEEAGAGPGEAAHWTLRTFVARERIAAFGPAPHRSVEDFTRWAGAWLDVLDAAVVGVFEPLREARETFEAGWDNDAFAYELPLGSIALAQFTGEKLESLEAGWGAGRFLAEWAEVSAVRAAFDGEGEESFARGWRANEGFTWAWAEIAGERAVFDGQPQETFDAAWTALQL